MTLLRSYSGSDQLYLSGEYVSSDQVKATTAKYELLDCKDLTAEVTPDI
jgi:hypothetical protein